MSSLLGYLNPFRAKPSNSIEQPAVPFGPIEDEWVVVTEPNEQKAEDVKFSPTLGNQKKENKNIKEAETTPEADNPSIQRIEEHKATVVEPAPVEEPEVLITSYEPVVPNVVIINDVPIASEESEVVIVEDIVLPADVELPIIAPILLTNAIVSMEVTKPVSKRSIKKTKRSRIEDFQLFQTTKGSKASKNSTNHLRSSIKDVLQKEPSLLDILYHMLNIM